MLALLKVPLTPIRRTLDDEHATHPVRSALNDMREKLGVTIGYPLIADMKLVNEKLEPHEEIAKIVVVKDAWTIDNGVMTPTMKVKRNEIEKRYAGLIEKEGATRTPIAWEA